MPRINVSKVKSHWKEHGTLGLVKKIVLRICRPFFSHEPLNFYFIVGLPQARLEARCPLEVRKGGPGNIDLMMEMLSQIDATAVRKQIGDYFDNGGEVFLAFSKGQLVHVAWLHYSSGVEKVYPHVNIKKDEAFIGRCDTHPGFRGNNIYPVVLQHIVRYATTKNINKCFISTAPTLVASIRGIEKAGFSFMAKLRKFRLLGKSFNNQWVSSDTVKPD